MKKRGRRYGTKSVPDDFWSLNFPGILRNDAPYAAAVVRSAFEKLLGLLRLKRSWTLGTAVWSPTTGKIFPASSMRPWKDAEERKLAEIWARQWLINVYYFGDSGREKIGVELRGLIRRDEPASDQADLSMEVKIAFLVGDALKQFRLLRRYWVMQTEITTKALLAGDSQPWHDIAKVLDAASAQIDGFYKDVLTAHDKARWKRKLPKKNRRAWKAKQTAFAAIQPSWENTFKRAGVQGVQVPLRDVIDRLPTKTSKLKKKQVQKSTTAVTRALRERVRRSVDAINKPRTI